MDGRLYTIVFAVFAYVVVLPYTLNARCTKRVSRGETICLSPADDSWTWPCQWYYTTTWNGTDRQTDW